MTQTDKTAPFVDLPMNGDAETCKACGGEMLFQATLSYQQHPRYGFIHTRCLIAHEHAKMINNTKSPRPQAKAVDEPKPFRVGRVSQGFGHSAKPDPVTLSLLVIDLGDSCVVKLEQGEMPKSFYDIGLIDFVTICRGQTFEQVCAAIDALDEKPVPRIEFDDHYNAHLITVAGDIIIGGRHHVDTLSQLAGHELPIYEPKPRGTWTQILGSQLLSGLDSPCQIWRYEVTG